MSRIALVLFAAALSGCLMPHQGPRPGAVATGEPLAVVDDVKVWTTTYKEKVGEASYHDSSGRQIGSASIYEDRTQVHSRPIWYPVQGGAQIADEDFFRIAGDEASLQATLEMRENGRKWRKRGMITIGAGIVGMLASYFVPNQPVQLTLLLGGSLATTGGYYMTYWGAQQLNPENHAVDRSVASRAALQYNQQLGHVGGVSVNKNF